MVDEQFLPEHVILYKKLDMFWSEEETGSHKTFPNRKYWITQLIHNQNPSQLFSINYLRVKRLIYNLFMQSSIPKGNNNLLY